jgi:hypothetical protein
LFMKHPFLHGYRLIVARRGSRWGTFIHFHKVFDRFEYPANWLMEGLSKLEKAYLIQSLLCRNSVR